MEGNVLKGNRRGSKILSLAPVVTTGGDAASSPTTTPPLSPSASMSPLARPPTHGGGPLSSHPTTPIDMPGAWISTSDLLAQGESQADKSYTPPLISLDTPPSSAAPSVAGGMEPSRHDSFRTPSQPASVGSQRRSGKGVRKLLSLSSLRNSFLGSRSASIGSAPGGAASSGPKSSLHAEASSQRVASRASSANFPQGIKRSASPSITAPSQENLHQPPQSPLHKRKSAIWFRRKSQIFLFGQDGDVLDSVAEAPARRKSTYLEPTMTKDTERVDDGTSAQVHHTYEAPRPYEASRSHAPPETYRSYTPPQTHKSYESSRPAQSPLRLPELDALGSGTFNGGSFGGEDMFANIGR